MFSGSWFHAPLKQCAVSKHRMHRDRQLPCQRDGRALEADAFPKLQSPGSQITFSRAAGQNDGCGLVQETSEVMIAPAGDVALVVDLTGLIPAGRQADPGTDGSGLPKVIWTFDRRDKRGRGDRTHSRDRHQDSAAIVLSGFYGNLPGKSGGLQTGCAPGVEHRQQDF